MFPFRYNVRNYYNSIAIKENYVLWLHILKNCCFQKGAIRFFYIKAIDIFLIQSVLSNSKQCKRSLAKTASYVTVTIHILMNTDKPLYLRKHTPQLITPEPALTNFILALTIVTISIFICLFSVYFMFILYRSDSN